MRDISKSVVKLFEVKPFTNEVEAFISKYLRTIDENNYFTSYEILNPNTIQVFYSNIKTGDMGYCVTIDINKQ